MRLYTYFLLTSAERCVKLQTKKVRTRRQQQIHQSACRYIWLKTPTNIFRPTQAYAIGSINFLHFNAYGWLGFAHVKEDWSTNNLKHTIKQSLESTFLAFDTSSQSTVALNGPWFRSCQSNFSRVCSSLDPLWLVWASGSSHSVYVVLNSLGPSRGKMKNSNGILCLPRLRAWHTLIH